MEIDGYDSYGRFYDDFEKIKSRTKNELNYKDRKKILNKLLQRLYLYFIKIIFK